MRALVPALVILLAPALALGGDAVGVLQDEVTREPFGGVVLEAWRDGARVARTTTAPDGRYALPLGAGVFEVRVTGDALCGTHLLRIDVLPGDDVAPEFHLGRCVHVRGRLFDRAGRPVPNGRVRLGWPSRPTVPDITVQADAAGWFTAKDVARGVVMRQLFDSQGRALAASGRWTVHGELEVRALPTLRVRVLSGAGLPLAEVAVKRVLPALATANLMAVTDGTGQVTFPADVRGPVRLIACWCAEGRFARYRVGDAVFSGEDDVEVTLRYPDAREGTPVTGRVVDALGQPVEGAEVEADAITPSAPLDDDFLRNSAYPLDSEATRTDAQGRFSLAMLSPGPYTLGAQRDFGATTALVTTPGPHELVLRPSCALRVTARLLDAEGKPLEEARVSGERVKTPGGRLVRDGTCWSLLIDVPGHLSRELDLGRAREGEVDLGDVRFERGRQLRGRVLSAEGQPLRFTRITARWGRRTAEHAQTYTDASGTYVLGPVPSREPLALTATFGALELDAVVPSGSATDVSFRCPPTPSRLELDVRGDDGRGLPIEFIVEGPWGRRYGRTRYDGRGDVALPPGPHTVHFKSQRPRSEARSVPTRVAPVSIDVPSGATLRREAHAERSVGRLRVLLPVFSHCAETHVLRGVHAWPARRGELGQWEYLEVLDDDHVDVTANTPRGYVNLGSSVLSDFSRLTPGTYTVFSICPWGENAGAVHRQVVEVDASRRTVVQAQCSGPEVRLLPE